MTTINYRELCNYLQEKQGINATETDVMRVERMCLSMKLEFDERLVCYATAAMKRFNIPVEQAIELAGKSLGQALNTFIDSLVQQSLNQYAPVAIEAAAAARSQLFQIYNQALNNPNLSDEEKEIINSTPQQLMGKYQAMKLKAQEEQPRSQMTLDAALSQMQNELQGTDYKQLQGF